jgi:hypothetical protein
MDVYFTHVVVCYREYTVDTCRTTVGNGMATAEGGETSEEERAGATGGGSESSCTEWKSINKCVGVSIAL